MPHLEIIGSPEEAAANQDKPESEKIPFLERAKQLWNLIDSGQESRHLGKPPGEVLLSKIDLSTWMILDYVLPYIDKNDPNFKVPQTLEEFEALKKNFTEVRKLSRNADLENTRPEDVNNGLVLAWVANKLMGLEEKFIAEAVSKSERGQFENQKQKNLPHSETAKWLDGIIKEGKDQRHLGDGSEIQYREIRKPIWDLVEAYRQGEFSGDDGNQKYIKEMAEARSSLGGPANNSEGLIIGWLGNALTREIFAKEMSNENFT